MVIDWPQLSKYFYTTKKGIPDTTNLQPYTQLSSIYFINSIFLQFLFSTIFIIFFLFALHRSKYQFKLYPKQKIHYQTQWIQKSVQQLVQHTSFKKKSKKKNQKQKNQRKLQKLQKLIKNFKKSHKQTQSNSSDQQSIQQLSDSENSIQDNNNAKYKKTRRIKLSLLFNKGAFVQKKLLSQSENQSQQYEKGQLSTRATLQEKNKDFQKQQYAKSQQEKQNQNEQFVKKTYIPIISAKQQNNIQLMIKMQEKILRICPAFIVFIIANNTFNISFQTLLCFLLSIILFMLGNIVTIYNKSINKKHLNHLSSLNQYKSGNLLSQNQIFQYQQKIKKIIQQSISIQNKSTLLSNILTFIIENLFFIPIFYTGLQILYGDFEGRLIL